MKLTIAQFTFGLQLAGQERVVTDLAKAFHERGHKSLVYTTLFGGELVDELETFGVPFKCFRLKRSYDPRGIVPMIRDLKKNKVDVVITHGSSGCTIPRIAGMLAKVPALMHVEHTLSNNKSIYHRIFDRVATRFTDKIICVSESAERSLLEIEKTDRRKIAVIRNGLNTKRFTPLKERAINKIKRIGVIGNFSPAKGHAYFVEAISLVIRVYGKSEIILVGDGPLRQEIEQKARDLGVKEHCKFLGRRTDIGDLLQMLDVFVSSSLWEGLSISLLEAQYFGVPSVVTAVGGNPEVVWDGYNGLLVPPRNPEALAQAILRLLRDSELRSKLGRNAQEVFRKKFSSEVMTGAYLSEMSSILRAKN